MRKANSKDGEEFEGFSVDLIKKLQEKLNFHYELYLVPDNKFGARLETGEWNGVVGEILSGVSSRPIYTASTRRWTNAAIIKPVLAQRLVFAG